MACFYLIDDSLFVLTQLKQILQKGGHEVCGSAQNGEAALQYLEEQHHIPDAITLDITMPGMDGMEVLRQIRERWPEKTCVIISGLAGRDLVLEARKLGAVGYIVKPLIRETVLDKLRELFPS